MGLEIKNLQIFYGDVEAVKDINLKIHNGEIVALIGESGCGKSTVLRAVAGLIPVRRGEITISKGNNIGMVFQNPALFPHLSVINNVLLPAKLTKSNSIKDAREKALNILDLVGLKGYEKRLPRELSGGQQQRVSLARSIITDPSVLLMDEPFGKLDAFTRKKLNQLILNLWERLGQTILWVTHDIEEAVFMSRKVVILSPQKAEVEKIVNIDIGYPRNTEIKKTEKFLHLVEKIEKHFE